MSTLKFLKIAALAAFIFTSLASVAQALTYQEIYQYQTQGQVLGVTTPPTNGLVGYWNFDEGTGTVANDSSGNGNNGTLVNAPAWTTGKINGALQFSSGSNVSRTSGFVANNTAFTISFWANTSVSANSPGAYSEALNSSANNNLLNIYYGDTFNSSVPQVRVYYSDPSGNVAQFGSGTQVNVADGAWHLVTLVQAASNSRELYIDAAPLASNATNVSPITPNAGEIGAAYAYSSFSQWVNAKIDEVRIYNRALSQQEITDIYNTTGSAPTPTPTPTSVPTPSPTLTPTPTPIPTPMPTPVPAPVGNAQDLEDWNCSQGAIPTAGTVTTFTCPEPHNFVAGTYVTVWNASGGSWANINTQEKFYLRQSIDATSLGQMLVTDTYFLPQTGNFVIYSADTGEHILVNVANSDTLNIVTRGYDSTTPKSDSGEMQWNGPLSANVSYPITITGTNTFTIPFNSTGYGTYSGNTITLQRSSFTYTSSPAQLLNQGASLPTIQPQSGHYATLTIPGCPSPSSSNQTAAFECAKAFSDPWNGKGYGGKAQVSSLVVSGGTGTLTLMSPYAYDGQEGGRTLGANQLFWIEGMNEGSNAFNSINRPWIMSAVNPGLTQFTIPGMGGQGVSDGTYTPTGTGQFATNNFWFPLANSVFYWLYGDRGSFPSGYTQQLIKAGPAFNPLDNRVSMYICWGKDFTPYNSQAGSFELGNYWWAVPSYTAAYHGYQSLNIKGFANECGQYTVTSKFNHIVNQSSPVYLPNDAAYNGWADANPWTGENGYHIWELVQHWYIDVDGLYSDVSNQVLKLGALTMSYVPNEPEEYILSRGVIYTGSAYEIDLQTPPTVSNLSYQYRWSTSDMKTTGFSTGICQSGNTTCNSSDSVNTGGNEFVRYTSANLAQSNAIYWGIRPTIPIVGTSGNGVSPIWAVTDFSPNFSIGDHVSIAGLTGNTAGNQSTAAVSGLFPRTTWWLNLPTTTWPGATTPGTLISVVSNGTNCTASLSVAHGIYPGWRIIVYVSGFADGTYQGHSYTVTSTPTANSFIFRCSGPTGIAAGTYNTDYDGTHMAIIADPAFSLSGTGNGNWSGETTATVVATDDTKNFAEIAFSPPGASGSIPNPTPTPTPVPTPTPNPVISNLVGSNTTASTTTISWNTDQLTNGQILYGLTSSYTFQSVVVDTNPQTTSHAILFSNLSPSTTYHFSAKSTNSTGQTSQTGDFSFTTLSAPAPTPSPTPSGSPTPTPTGSPTPTGTPVPTPSPTPTPIPVPTTAPAPSGGGGGGGGSPSNPPSPSGGGGGSSSPVVVYIPPSTSTPASPSSPSSSTTRLINIKGTYYLEDNGQLRGITNPGMLASYGFTFAEAQTPTAQDLTLPKGNLLSPGDGSLVKSSQDPTVYLISNQTRYAFTSAKVFSSLGFKFSSVLIVTNPELQILPKGPDISSPASQHLPGTDINNKGTIYWIGQDNQLHGYPSLTTYNSWHIQNDFSTVVPADSADLGLPVGRSVAQRLIQ